MAQSKTKKGICVYLHKDLWNEIDEKRGENSRNTFLSEAIQFSLKFYVEESKIKHSEQTSTK
jgi:metal-responsive CopG/Arc/MetJ family transcriptional regulator